MSDKKLFATADITSGQLNALVKNIVRDMQLADPQGGPVSPEEAVRRINAAEWEVVKSISKLIVDHTKGFKALVAECGNDIVSDGIVEEHFPITEVDSGEWEYDLWDPCGAVLSEFAIKHMKGDDKENPWMPARLGLLLVFGTKNPNAQCENPIVALGSVYIRPGNSYVPVLDAGGSKRFLRIDSFQGRWHSGFRFLRFRKVVKKS